VKFIEINNFVIMQVGITPNELEITEKAIWNCLDKDGFVNKPIILNKNQELKDYTSDEVVQKYIQNQCIGYITGNVCYNPCTGNVAARVSLSDKFLMRTHFDNWQIQYDKETGDFDYIACELFSELDSNDKEDEYEQYKKNRTGLFRGTGYLRHHSVAQGKLSGMRSHSGRRRCRSGLRAAGPQGKGDKNRRLQNLH
jgi:hypothetical protein